MKPYETEFTELRCKRLEEMLTEERTENARALANAAKVCKLWADRAAEAERELELLRRESAVLREQTDIYGRLQNA